jgi:predicted PurR-regulated permease PerM
VALVLLVLGCLWVVRPFVSSLLWAGVLCFSAWPAYRWLLARMPRRRTLAAALMTLSLLLVFLLPFVVAGISLADDVKNLATATQKWLENGPPDAPGWLDKIPVIGPQATAYWQSLAGDSQKLMEEVKRLVEPVSASLLRGGIKLGHGLVELAMSIFIAFFLFRDGAAVVDRLRAGIEKIAGAQGTHLLDVAGQTVRGVVYGILGTALVQAVVAGLGFLIAGVPGTALLALLTFFLSVVPMGPPLIWIPATIWLFNQGRPGWGIFMGVWGLGVSSIDNVVKPWLISQGCELPFILIFFGVVGGALAFGFIGVFLGPTLLAVGYRLIGDWAASAPVLKAADPAKSGAPGG